MSLHRLIHGVFVRVHRGHLLRPLPFTATLHQNSNIRHIRVRHLYSSDRRHQNCLRDTHCRHQHKLSLKLRENFSLPMADQAVVEKMSELQVGAANKVKSRVEFVYMQAKLVRQLA